MSYFNPCPRCGANLDPCETCDCEEDTQRIVKDKRAKNSPLYITQRAGITNRSKEGGKKIEDQRNCANM